MPNPNSLIKADTEKKKKKKRKEKTTQRQGLLGPPINNKKGSNQTAI